MGKRRIKQYLMLLMAIGVIAVVASGGSTFATFSAETTNAGNTFANGTLYLHDDNGSTTCKSESQTTSTFNYNESCFALMSATTLSNAPVSATLNLTNAGTINASALKFAVANCNVTTTDGATAPPFVALGSSAGQFGCQSVDLTVQEVDGSSNPVYCAYGTVSSSSCSIDGTHTLATSQTAGLTALKTTGGVAAGLAASAVRHYVVTIQPDTTGFSDANALQDVKLTFDLKWHIDQ